MNEINVKPVHFANFASQSVGKLGGIFMIKMEKPLYLNLALSQTNVQ